VLNGQSIQTSMGLTPLSGIMMGTRSGDIDPSIIARMCEKLNKTAAEITTILNNESGMLGVSGISSDAREVEEQFLIGNERAILTYEIYTTRIAETIGAYFIRLGGLDAIAFTAGIGENDTIIRKMVIEKVGVALNMKIDEAANNTRGKAITITTNESAVKALIMPTDEEIVIATETTKL